MRFNLSLVVVELCVRLLPRSGACTPRTTSAKDTALIFDELLLTILGESLFPTIIPRITLINIET